MRLVPNQELHAVVRGESGQGFFLVHPYAFDEIVGHANVQRSVPPAREDVDKETHRALPLDPRFRGGVRKRNIPVTGPHLAHGPGSVRAGCCHSRPMMNTTNSTWIAAL